MTGWSLLGRFFHGLIFFTLALTVVFLQYRSRRILLARRLYWFGAFAMCEAFIAWNGLFVAFSPEIVGLPYYLRPAILALGYVFLIAFGVQSFYPEDDDHSCGRLMIGLNLAWLMPYILTLGLTYPHWDAVIPVLETLIRYFLAFPAGVLTAFGLRRQSYQTLDIDLRTRIRPYLQLVEMMVAAFGLLNLILVPATSFFPADQLNVYVFGAFPVAWLWFIVGAGITLGLSRALTLMQRYIEQWVEGIERLQALAVDRERIGRDLHDGIIQSIYASGLLLESVQHIILKDPVRAQSQLGRVMENLNETIQNIRRYIFDLRSDMPDDDIKSGLERLLRDFRINTLLETNFQWTGTPVEIRSIERRRHIFQVVREALTNTAKHAKAAWVEIQLEYGAESLELIVSDDGVGMETLLVSKGYGLRNIRERVRLLDGTLRIESAPGAGVIFHLLVPY